MRVNAYVIVFGLVGIVIIAAAVSSLLGSQGPSIATQDVSKLPNLGRAPNFQGVEGWINSGPLNISQLAGEVVLVDFWTYSCINCIRTIPYLNALYSRYGGDGLVVVGVHTPEFQFEKNYTNVLAAVRSFGINYPVALDSNAVTWNAYGNHYWPADYLVDKNGEVRHVHLGEGDYNGTESVIRGLLLDAGYNVGPGTVVGSVNGTTVNFLKIRTPELYLGYDTARSPIGNSQGFSPGHIVDYLISGSLQNNTVYFSGMWFNANDSMVAAGSGSKLYLIYDAKVVNIVAHGNFSMITVNLDGNVPPQEYFGGDLASKDGLASANIGMARLYYILNAPSYGWHELEISASPGFALYTFTFG